MAKEILCPICGATYNLAEEQLGKKVRCKKCEHAFTAGGEQKRREDDDDTGLQDAPRGRSRAKKGRARDDEDEPRRKKKTRSADEQARPRGAREPGLPMTSIVIAGIAVGVIVLCCGGGGIFWWLAPSSAPPNGPVVNQPVVPNQPKQPDRPNQQQPPRPVEIPPPPIVFPPDNGFPNVGQPAGNVAVTTLKEALDALKQPDAAHRRAGADWLGRAPRDEAKAVEVSKALDPLVRDARPDTFLKDEARTAALRALKTWGTKENVPTLVTFLKDMKQNEGGSTVFIPGDLKDAMSALVKIGDERGAEAILPWVGSFHLGDFPERALRDMGPKAEKGLVKYYNEPNEGTRNAVRRLLQQTGAKPDVILAQVVVDMKTGDAGHRRLAAESLEKLPLVPAQRDEVSKALNLVLEDGDGNVAAAGVRAAKVWGTKENVAALSRQVSENGPFSTPQRVGAMEALAAIKDEAGVWPIARWLGDFFNNQSAQSAIEKFGPVAEKVGLEHLKDLDGQERLKAWKVLALVGTKGNVPVMNAVGVKETDPNLRNAATIAIRMAQLRP